MTQPLLFTITDLNSLASIRVEAQQHEESIGWTEVVLREQFPVEMKGQFDMWFKLNEGAERLISPEKQRAGRGESRDSSRSQRLSRIRLHVSLCEISTKPSPEEIPEGLPACPRCSYLEKLIVSMELELEGKSAIKLMLSGDFEGKYDPITEETAVETDETPKHDLSPEEAEIEHLKLVILALTQHISSLQSFKSQSDALVGQLAACEEGKCTQEIESKQAFKQLRNQTEELAKELEICQNELRQRDAERGEWAAEIRETHGECLRLKAELEGKRGWEQGKRGKDASGNELIAQNESLIQRLLVQEAEFEALQAKYESKIHEFDGKIRVWTTELDSANKEKCRIRSESEDLRKTLSIAQANIDQIKQELIITQSALSQAQAERDYLASSLSRDKCNTSNLSISEAQRLQLAQEIAILTEEYEDKVKEIATTGESLAEENSRLVRECKDRENSELAVTEELERVNTEKQEAEREVISLRRDLIALRQAEETGQEYRNRLETSREAQARLLADLDFLANSLVSVSERSYEVSRLVPRLKLVAEEKDTEVEVLRGVVAELQKARTVYVPASNDPVDTVMASFVNSHSQLPVSFYRQDEGIYLFGTKRVFIKLENGNIVSNSHTVRVGGGFMRLEEFMQVYTPLEMGKLQSSHEKRRLLKSELLSRLAASSHEVRRGGKLEMSPQRAAKIIKEFMEEGGEQFATCFAVQRRAASPSKPQRSRPSDLRSSQHST
jgi:hypothetical protein